MQDDVLEDNRFHRVALECPHDGAPLRRADKRLVCSAGHSFDIARQGYLHLLPVAHKASRSPGDSAAMVAARREVLDSGLFAPLLDALLARESLAGLAQEGGCVIDAGCGEGHYVAALATHWPALRLLGIDISKAAVRAAAQRHPGIAFVVASNRQLPVASGLAPLILCLFGFACWQAWAAHQRAGQRVITADPGMDHLLELRERIYPQVRQRAAVPHADAARAGYVLLDEQRVRKMGDAPPLAALLEMTPHGRRIDRAARERLVADPPDAMTIDVTLREWQREPDPVSA